MEVPPDIWLESLMGTDKVLARAGGGRRLLGSSSPRDDRGQAGLPGSLALRQPGCDSETLPPVRTPASLPIPCGVPVLAIKNRTCVGEKQSSSWKYHGLVGKTVTTGGLTHKATTCSASTLYG